MSFMRLLIKVKVSKINLEKIFRFKFIFKFKIEDILKFYNFRKVETKDLR